MVNSGLSALLFLTSLGASALGGALGMASGIFIVPILTTAFGLNVHLAIAASLVSVIACSCASAAPFLRDGFTNIRVAIVLEVATTIGALSGVALSGLLSNEILYGLFALILIVSAKQMLAKREDIAETINSVAMRDVATLLRLHSSYPSQDGRTIQYRVQRVPLGLGFMYGAGLLSALLGIGSGVLKIPAMDAALRLPIKVSSATSNFMIGVTATASAAAYFIRGDIHPGLAAPIALGSVLGAALGGKLLMSLSGERTRLFFVVVLVALALQMTLLALGIEL
ncbi:MAG: sulfite exporter TauE/SafE family protein [Afipia felis]|nr:sulfite exporter TauE/SafE family protein [Afipia felis]